MSSARPHLCVDDWLQKLDLSVYASLFKKYNGVEDMLHLSERELKNFGIKNSAHRARLATSLAILKEKYEKTYKNNKENLSRHAHTLSVDDSRSKSIGSTSPVHRLNLENASGVRSWPSSGTSSLNQTRSSSHRSSMEGSIGTDATAEELKRALERELSLDNSDLRSYAWYHGTILRQRAEELVVKDGDFIVRDCISQPGDFVITCKWKGLPLHFIVKKVIVQPNTVYEKVQYCFENDNFDSVPDFITYYVGSKCPLSSKSGPVISHPINRTMPLSYYASRYSIQCQMHYAARALEKIPKSPDGSPLKSPSANVTNSPLHVEVNSKFPKACTSPNGENVNSLSIFARNTPKTASQRKILTRVGSDPSLNPNLEKKSVENRPNSGTVSTEATKIIASQMAEDKPPPKPSRVPSRKCAQKPFVIKRERRMTPPTPLDEQENSPFFVQNDFEEINIRSKPVPISRQISGETRFSFLDRPSVSDDGSESSILGTSLFTLPALSPESCFNPSEFKSSLILAENKPLESTVLQIIRKMLVETSPKLLACHLTRIDLEIAKNFREEDLGLGVTSGLELILLPQGHQLVIDLLERTECMKLFVAISILTCSVQEERVQIIKKWIETAVESKTTLGNFYGFTGIMLGLTIPEVSHLQSTWLSLRHLHTNVAFIFETKLRPAFKSLQETTCQTAPNTCMPYILSLLCILHHHLSHAETLIEEPLVDQFLDENLLKFNYPGEENSSDFGLQVLENHLEAGRNIIQQLPVFQKNGEISLTNVKYDNLLLDVFRTDLHLRILWGCRGAIVPSKIRHSKFQKVLLVLHEKCV